MHPRPTVFPVLSPCIPVPLVNRWFPPVTPSFWIAPLARLLPTLCFLVSLGIPCLSSTGRAFDGALLEGCATGDLGPTVIPSTALTLAVRLRTSVDHRPMTPLHRPLLSDRHWHPLRHADPSSVHHAGWVIRPCNLHPPGDCARVQHHSNASSCMFRSKHDLISSWLTPLSTSSPNLITREPRLCISSPNRPS